MMNLSEMVRVALEGNSILFAGSGFNYKAKNILDQSFKTSEALRDTLAKSCGYEESKLDLGKIARIFKKKYSANKLIQLLKQEFTVKTIEPHHQTVMSVSWRRVYTTNYDRVIECAASKSGFPMMPVTMSDKIKEVDTSCLCVHVNGFIDRLNEKTLDTEFKLTDRSYNAESLNGKDFFELMKSDFKTAQSIIIIGFSMQYDLDITRLIALPYIREKTAFIIADTAGDDEYESLSEYGLCERIGIQGVAKEVERLQKVQVKSDMPIRYKNFLHEYHASYAIGSVSYRDLVNFYCSGIETESLFNQNELGEYRYLAGREELLKVLQCIYDYKVVLILSGLGNGKSVFLKMLRRELAAKDIHVFTYQRGGIDWEQDVENIVRMSGHKVVIIDSYMSKLDVLRRFWKFSTNEITFVLSERTSVNIKSYNKLRNIMGSNREKIKYVRLDKLSNADLKTLANIFLQEGVLSDKYQSSNIDDIVDYLVNICKSEFANILLDLFDSSDIKNRLLYLYSERMEISENIYHMCVFSLIQTVSNINLDNFDIFDIFEIDYVELKGSDLELVNEVFEITEHSIVARSSIVARELLVHVIDFQKIIDVMIYVFHEANKRYHSNRAMEETLKNIISHSNFLIYTDNIHCADGIVRYYDAIRNDEFCINNPFFWEQFASAYIDIHQYEYAKRCIKTAYTIAKGKPDFVPYQIDSVNGRCIMEEMMDESFPDTSSDSIMSKFKECHSVLMRNYTAVGNNVYYTFRIGKRYADFYEKFSSYFGNRELSTFINVSTEMCRKMDVYLHDHTDIYTDSIAEWKLLIESALHQAKEAMK